MGLASYDNLQKTVAVALRDSNIFDALARENFPFVPQTQVLWARLTFKPVGIVRETLTGERVSGQKVMGLAVVQIFVPEGDYVRNLYEAVDQVVDLYNERRLLSPEDPTYSNVVTQRPETTMLGSVSENGKVWYQANVAVECSQRSFAN